MSVKRVRGKGYDSLTLALNQVSSEKLKVGWVTAKLYPDSKMTTAQVAAIAESGSARNNIPARPIIRPTIIREKNTWIKIVENEAKSVIKGNQSTVGLLNILGAVASGDMRKTITQIMTPPLKIATVKARERTYAGRRKTKTGRKNQIKQRLESTTLHKPLVFTKNLLNSLTYSVEER